MLGKKGLGEVHKIRNRMVVCVRPKAGKLKAVGCLFAAAALATFVLLDVAKPGGIRVVFGMGAIGDDKNLHSTRRARNPPKSCPAGSG